MRIARALILASLLVPLAAADRAFSASSFVSGPAHIAAQAPAVFVNGTGSTIEILGNFSMEIQEVVFDANFGSVVVTPQTKNPTTANATLGSPASGTPWMANAFLYIIPREGSLLVNASLLAVSFGAAAPCTPDPGPKHYDGQYLTHCIPTPNALRVQSLVSPDPVAIEGDMDLVGWGWNFTSGEDGVWSGERAEPVGATTGAPPPPPQAPPPPVWQETRRMVKVHCQCRVLLSPDQDPLFAFDSVRIDDARLARLQGTEQGDLELTGSSSLRLGAKSGDVAVAVLSDGKIRPVTANPASALGSPASGNSAWVVGGSAALLLVAALALLRRRRDPHRRLAEIATLMDSGDHAQAAKQARRLRERVESADLVIVEAIAHIKAGRLDEADLLVDDQGDQIEPAARSFLKASIRVQQGDETDARQHLAACFAADPDYREEAGLHPALRRLLEAGSEGAYS